MADRLRLVVGGREHPGHDLARRRADQAGDAKDGDVSAPGLDAVSGDGQERLALGIGPGRDGHRVDDPRGAAPDHRPDRPGQPGILVEIPDLHHLVLAAREQREIVLPEQAPHPRMVTAGLDHEDGHPEVPHLVLRPGRLSPRGQRSAAPARPPGPPCRSARSRPELSSQRRSSSVHVSRLRWRLRTLTAPRKSGSVATCTVFSGSPA